MTLRVMTYNIRAALGTDRRRSVERVAEVIAAEAPDIVALQEVDFHRRRSGGIDQAERIGELIDMRPLAGASFDDPDGGAYGNALLTRSRARLVRHSPLPTIEGRERRSAMWARLRTRTRTIDIVCTHLSFRVRDRRRQAQALLGRRWLGSGEMLDAHLLCGDLNCVAGGPGCRALRSRLRDAPIPLRRRRAMRTWPTRLPMRRLDFILSSPELVIESLRVVRTPPARVASDHFPVLAEIDWRRERGPSCV